MPLIGCRKFNIYGIWKRFCNSFVWVWGVCNWFVWVWGVCNWFVWVWGVCNWFVWVWGVCNWFVWVWGVCNWFVWVWGVCNWFVLVWGVCNWFTWVRVYGCLRHCQRVIAGWRDRQLLLCPLSRQTEIPAQLLCPWSRLVLDMVCRKVVILLSKIDIIIFMSCFILSNGF